MNARYTPWWLPTALVVLLLTNVGLITTLFVGDKADQTGATDSSASSQVAGTVYKWDLVMSWPKRFPGLGLGPENFAAMVNDMSGGRLVISVHGANTIVPALGVFDAVSSGSVEMGHSAAYYWSMNAQEFNGWINYGGGLALWRELYAPYNLIPFPGGNTGVQMGGWFNTEINSVADLKGLKMRIPGLGGEVFTRAGGTAVNIPGAELYNALQTGVIDATEWVGPYNDLAIGFHQIAEYYYYPGWHEAGPALEFTVNKTAYESLPADLQKIIEVAAQAVNQDMLDEYQARSTTALVELKETYNVDIRPFPKDVMSSFKGHAMAIYSEQSDRNDDFKRISKAYFDYLENAKAYSEISDKAYYQLR